MLHQSLISNNKTITTLKIENGVEKTNKQTNKIIVLKWAVQASTPNTTTEVPLRKAPNPQLLPGRCSINDWPLLRVCVHGVCVCSLLCVCTLDGINAEHEFRVYGSPYLAVCPVTFTFFQ